MSWYPYYYNESKQYTKTSLCMGCVCVCVHTYYYYEFPLSNKCTRRAYLTDSNTITIKQGYTVIIQYYCYYNSLSLPLLLLTLIIIKYKYNLFFCFSCLCLVTSPTDQWQTNDSMAEFAFLRVRTSRLPGASSFRNKRMKKKIQ